MVDAVLIKINDNFRQFHFNNFAMIELGKLLKCDPMSAQDELMKIAGDDVFMGLTIVLTAGFIGWEKSQFNLNHGITPQLIAKEIATCDINDFTEAWESFKSATGISEFLEEHAKKEAEESKKKTKTKTPTRPKK